MKKLFAMLLAVVMIFSLSTVAFAEEAEAEVLTSKAATYTAVIKAYTVNGATDAALYPAETLKFTVAAGEGNPDDTMLTVTDLVVTGVSDQHLQINVPAYTNVGLYHYTISETAGNTQGVTYTDGTIDVSVLVTYDYEDADNDGCKLTATVGITAEGTSKVDTFTNVYDLGALTVSKKVTGNLGDTSKKFNVTVTFTATKDVLSTITYEGGSIAPADWNNGTATVVIALAHGDSVTFSNIPAGVTYTVVEDDYTGGELNGENAYDKAEYKFSDDGKAIAKEDADTVEITNHKDTDVDTGITLDSVPYIVILVVAAFGMFAMLTKKRYEV